MGSGLIRALAVAAGPPEQPLRIPADIHVAGLTLELGITAAPPDSPALPLRPGQLIRLVYPLAVKASEVDSYGWRYSSSRGAWRMHANQDLDAPAGTFVLAMLPGRVVLAESIDGYGLTVVLDHGRSWQSIYAHLQRANVRPGDFLTAASTLGLVGKSGRASSPHLHVELRQRQGEHMLAFDPPRCWIRPPAFCLFHRPPCPKPESSLDHD